ncbi:hypothetical protein EVAR_79993_1 [Eumeta japonica]|uniref:Uncharacterized protein n=1 Tax=Eumeta variegata TaxID=151549 RepID=A0A4C1ZS02_EUMVA|nr:hypothetical protein EVAR_79993_1 [Eumeta japonica]
MYNDCTRLRFSALAEGTQRDEHPLAFASAPSYMAPRATAPLALPLGRRCTYTPNFVNIHLVVLSKNVYDIQTDRRANMTNL